MLLAGGKIEMRDFNNNRDDRSFRKGGFGGGRDFGPREMHKTVCSECGQECEVPFKPIEGRPVYCKECFMKKKEENSE